MKQKIKITILTLAVFLLFSCQIEEEVIKRDINLQNFKVEQKSYHELMQTIIFTKAISDLTNKSQTRNPKSEQQSKTIMETQYGFTILDSPVNITETNEIVSYTILIKSDSKIDVACFENLVMNVNKQSNILSAYLLKHKLAGTENQNNHPKSLIKSETTIKPIVFNNANYNSKIDTSCYTIFIPTCQKPWENYGEENPYPYVEPHPLTAECLEDINYITVEELQICIDSFGPDDDTPNPINDSQNPNSNNNYGGSSNSSNVITAPVVPTYTSVNLTTELSLNQEQQDWINNPAQFKIKKELQQFLFNNPFNNGNQLFLSNLITEIMNTPIIPLPSNINLVIPTPAKKIADIEDYLKCFDLSQPAVFTLYVDQPTANSNSAWSGNPLGSAGPNVGHTFISIKQGGIRRVLGFYPSSAVNLDSPAASGVFENNSAHEFDVSLSSNIDNTQLSNIVNYIKIKSTATYNLNNYNCTDFGMGAISLAGFPLPSAYGTWGAPGVGSGSGDNPGQLGQNIRNMTVPSSFVKTTTTNNSQSNIGACL